LRERVLPPPKPNHDAVGHRPADEWSKRPLPASVLGVNERVQAKPDQPVDDPAIGGIRREPELPEHEEVAPERTPPVPEFAFSDEEPDDEVQRAIVLRRQVSSVARQAAMDPGDGIDL
jgi:type IV secretion system protein VirD4